MRREDLEAGVGGGNEHDHHASALRRPFLCCVGDGSLVAVVPVRDQELPVGERLRDTVTRNAPEPGAVGNEIGLALGRDDRRVSVIEEEDRLELGPRCAQEPQTALLRPGVRPFVREHRPRLVGLDPKRGDKALTTASNAVRADVVLAQGPDSGLVVLYEHALVEPRPKQPTGLVLGLVQR